MSRQTLAQEDRARLMAGEIMDRASVRPEILASWLRCRSRFGCAEPAVQQPPHERDIAGLLREHGELVEFSRPIMEEYAETFRAARAVLFLCSPDGRVLSLVGDTSLARRAGLDRGICLDEHSEGTTAVGLCIRQEAFAEVTGAEHFSSRWQNFVCCAEALRGGRYLFTGVLAMLIRMEDHHIGMSSLVSTLGRDMNSQHHVQDLLNDQSAVMELLNDGIIVLNRQGDVKAVNANARRLLGIPGEESVALGHISRFVKDGEPFMNILRRKRRIVDEETSFMSGGVQKRCILSASFIPQEKGVVCTLANMERMQRYAARTAGSKAIYTFTDILGRSDALKNAIQIARVAAQSDITTLLLGESGTGKELFAHAVHNGSARKNGPFVAVNCGALPRELVQSELFGYESGAFTGAARNGKPGKFELADGGTIFLDEIGEMPMDVQANLLRLLQNKEVSRVGGTTTKEVDVRIIAATNRNLTAAVERGSFRSDLYYRLCVLVINIPSLRSRDSDITLLAEHFLHKYASALGRDIRGFTPEAMRILQNCPWPGNIRELENVVEYVVNMATQPYIRESDLPAMLRPAPARELSPQPTPERMATLSQLERQSIIDTLARCNGNVRLASQELDIARSALYNKLTRFGIDPASFRHKYRY